MSRALPLPYLPLAPREYDARYMNDLVRAVDQFMRQSLELGEGTFSTIRLTNLQEGNDQGLDVGVLFHVDGVVHITRLDTAYISAVSASASVGTVTVVTS